MPMNNAFFGGFSNASRVTHCNVCDVYIMRVHMRYICIRTLYKYLKVD